MKQLTQILSVPILTLILAIAPFAGSFAQESEDTPAQAAPPAVLLAEVGVGSSESASEEFVEIVNLGVEPLDVTGLELQYRSRSGSTWTTKAELSGLIAPYGRNLLTNYLDTPGAVQMSGGFAGSGGHVRLLWGEVEIDRLGWGGAEFPEGEAAEAPASGQSLKRAVDEDGYFIDGDDNAQDWFVSEQPSPRHDAWEDVADSSKDEPVEEPPLEEEPETPEPEEEAPVAQDPEDPDVTIPPNTDDDESQDSGQPKDEDTPSEEETPKASAPVQITELLPDPVSPMKDAEDEFVELFNPNNFAVQLEGYVLEAGTNWRYQYTIGAYELQPGEYLALYSRDTGLTLSNSGSDVRILAPNGVSLQEVAYPKAKAGAAWAYVAGEWQWANPTNNLVNEVSSFAELSEEEAETPTASVLGVTSSDDDVSPPLNKQETTYPAVIAEEGGESEQAEAAGFSESETESPSISLLALALIGSLALLYAIYEYRDDIRVRGQQLRRYLAARREDRQST